MNGSSRREIAVALERPRRPGLVLLIAVAAILVLSLIFTAADASGAKPPATKPTIVLVHGAWAGPAGWDQVVRELLKHNYTTVTPTLDLMTVAGDVATVQAALDGISGMKILVGHSYGGFVISGASAGRSDVLGLVYTAAFVPDEGDSILSLGEGYVPPAVLPHLAFTGEFFNSPSYIAPPFFHSTFAADLSAEQANAMNAEQRPANAPLLGTQSGPVGWNSLPSWYALSGHDLVIDPALQLFMAERIGATTIEFADASHVGGFTRYAKSFADLIEEAVRATEA
jgi:pimeloyl-ACP methyl ester carboxylesterase